MATYQETKIIWFFTTGVLALTVGQILGRTGTPGPLSWIFFLPALTVAAFSYALDCPLLKMYKRVVRSAVIWGLMIALHFIPLAGFAALLYARGAPSLRTGLLMFGINLLLQLLIFSGTVFWRR